ncbi:MAG: hypothetical protein QOG55_3559 [Acidobacteriaceae bacterium]|jgi:hypothetical protein|nr:hypothetical protein [Acidobacteriaceae bacterium]
MKEPENTQDDDLDQLIASEATLRRGKGQISREQRLEDAQLQRDIIRAMHEKNERKFSAMLRKAGVKDGDDRWVNAWKVYRAFWGQL